MSDLAEKLAEEVAGESRLEDQGKACLKDQIADFLNRFQVDDLRCDDQNTKVVLLCESPDVHEVEVKYPLAGKSGISVTKVLWKDVLCKPENQMPKDAMGKECAIGELIKRKCSVFDWLGIMNVSTLPLQLDSYARPEYSPARLQDAVPFIRTLRDFLKIKDFEKSKSITGKESDLLNNGIGKIIRDDLRCRLMKTRQQNSNVLFVLCGNVSRKYFNAAINSSANNPICVPHPSRNQWYHECNEKSIAAMCERVRLHSGV